MCTRYAVANSKKKLIFNFLSFHSIRTPLSLSSVTRFAGRHVAGPRQHPIQAREQSARGDRGPRRGWPMASGGEHVQTRVPLLGRRHEYVQQQNSMRHGVHVGVGARARAAQRGRLGAAARADR